MGSIFIKVREFPTKSETFVLGQMEVITQLGYDLRVLVNKKNELSVSSNPELVKKLDVMNRVTVLPIDSSSRFLKRGWLILKGLLKLPPLRSLKLLSTRRYGEAAIRGRYLLEYLSLRKKISGQVVHVQFGDNVGSLDKYKELNLVDFKLIVTFHGYDAHFTDDNFEMKRMEYKRLFEVGDFFTCNTSFLASKLIALGCPEKKLRIMPVPPNAMMFLQGYVKRELGDVLNLVSVGRLIELKGHGYGLMVVKELLDKGVKVKYTIVGEGDQLDELQKLVSELSIESNVTFLGALAQQEIKELLDRMDIFLMPSVTDRHGRQEAQGVVVLEAQACGIPVIAFSSGGLSDVVQHGETGFLVEERNVLSMTEAVLQLFNNSALYKIMSEQARSYVIKYFSQEKSIERWNEVYKKLLSER
ncbi:glycosyltransferase [Parvicella tangerina]|uniref:D-inositol-3-phosphate glycosyltransferase n=1 Tax=Parvicella tangerina TaxID=2829795 RepID=A0A916NGF4_9FLAO|nr:glycosyltransferase [Parvicella tangerina]CAG5079693.1 D-inositol-3-phosphate glycosyltransferase [Parvicella tangerina]